MRSGSSTHFSISARNELHSCGEANIVVDIVGNNIVVDIEVDIEVDIS